MLSHPQSILVVEVGDKVISLDSINLNQNPDLIQPPKVDDNIVRIRLIADSNDIITADIIDVALSYSIAGIEVILEIPFETRTEFKNKQLASLISNGSWSLSLLPPIEYSEVLVNKYCEEVVEWYQLWHSTTMRNFEQTIYPVTPYCEYLATNYLIDKNAEGLVANDIQTLRDLSANPSNPYLLHFIDNMQTGIASEFKQKLQDFIKKNDPSFYQDIDLLSCIENIA